MDTILKKLAVGQGVLDKGTMANSVYKYWPCIKMSFCLLVRCTVHTSEYRLTSFGAEFKQTTECTRISISCNVVRIVQPVFRLMQKVLIVFQVGHH